MVNAGSGWKLVTYDLESSNFRIFQLRTFQMALHSNFIFGMVIYLQNI